MSRRFTLAGLLLWVTFVALVLAIVVPFWRAIRSRGSLEDMVVGVAASGDGSTFAALFGDGRVRVWDSAGRPKATLHTRGGFGGRVALSFDGSLAAVARGIQPGVFAGQTRGSVEVWDVASAKLKQTLSSAVLPDVAFSPDGKWLLVQENFAAPELHSLVDQKGPTTIAVNAACAAFSPDGKYLAVAPTDGQVELWEPARLQFHERLGLGSGCVDLAWAPDGKTLAALYAAVDEQGESAQPVLETMDLASGQSHAVDLPTRENLEQKLTYLPNGRMLALTTEGETGCTLLDAKTLEPLPSGEIPGAWHVAAGLRGDSVLTADIGSIDLCDVASLRPRLRLFEMASAPNLWPALSGLMVWMFVFLMRRARKLARVCHTCGQKFQPAGKNGIPTAHVNPTRKFLMLRAARTAAERQRSLAVGASPRK